MAKNLNKVRDLTGQRFGRLVVIGIDERNTKKTYWNCLCDCGNIKSVRSDSLQCGAIKSCGCLKREQDKANLVSEQVKKSRKFGEPYGHLRIHNIWANMKSRCFNMSDKRYPDYGGRGITICEEWKNDFMAFYHWSMVSGYDDSLTIDRIDNSKGYFPSNCRWASAKEQSRNRRSNINIKIGNVTKTLTEWCEVFDLPYAKVHARYIRNEAISLEDLFKS